MKRSFLALFILIVIIALVYAALVSFQGGGEDPDAWERRHNENQPPGQVMDSIGVEAGMTVGEVGAGRGRYVVHMADRVGPEGLVYANDIDKASLDYLEHRCERDTISNVATILGEVTDPKFPEAALDLVYIINTYHHLDKPVELMRNIIPGLKPDGVLVIIEHDTDKYPAGGSHSTPKDEVIGEAEEAGFELIRMIHFLERDTIYILRPVG